MKNWVRRSEFDLLFYIPLLLGLSSVCLSSRAADVPVQAKPTFEKVIIDKPSAEKLSAARADKTAPTIGYFRAIPIDRSNPGIEGEIALRHEADGQLELHRKQTLEKMQKLKAEHKNDTELRAFLHDDEIAFASKRQVLENMITSKSGENRLRVIRAISEVAKEKKLDFIADGDHLFCDAGILKKKGLDVTNDIIRKMQTAPK